MNPLCECFTTFKKKKFAREVPALRKKIAGPALFSRRGPPPPSSPAFRCEQGNFCHMYM
jgi:hypothetical protein